MASRQLAPAAGVGGAREEHVDLLLQRAAALREILGAIDPDRALVAVLGELAGEQAAGDGACLLGGAAREITGAVLGRIIGRREHEVARVGLERRGVVALRELVERGDGAGERGWRGLLALAEAHRGGLLRVREIGIGLEVRVGRAAGIGEAEREHRRVLVAADLHREPVPALAHGERDAEALAVEVSVFCILQDLDAVEEDLRGASRAEPHRERAARRADLCAAAIADVRRGVGADLLRGPHHRAEIDPAVGEHVGRDAVRDRALLALVRARHAQRVGDLVLGAERAVEPALALVVERTGHHPAAHEAERGDARLRAGEVAAAPPRVGLEQPGVRAERRREARVGRERPERLLDLRGIPLIPFRP